MGAPLTPPLTPGPEVLVGGVAYPTVITPSGSQHFVPEPLISACFACGALNLNRLAEAYQNGTSGLTQRQYAELNMKLGYTVAGFADLPIFKDMVIENPLWSGR